MQLRWMVCAGVLLLGACSSMNDWLEGKDKTDYKSSKTLPPLEVPPDLATPSRDSRFAVPDAEGTTSATLSGYQAGRRQAKPSSGGLLPVLDGMHIERDGSQRWLVVDQPPQKLWPLIKEFWQENGFLIKAEERDVGVMETDWVESRPKFGDGPVRNILSRALDSLYSSGLRDQYRTRLEHTPDGKGTEIYISHRGLEEVYESRDAGTSSAGNTKWQPRPNDPELEVEFLRRMMVSLGAKPEQATELVKAAEKPAAERARIKKGVSGELLEVDEPFDRAWRRVGLALDRVGFTVEDRDRQKGLYFVRYADPDSPDTRGFFSRMFSAGNRTLATEQYRIQVSEAGSASQVNVLNKEGGAEKSKAAQRILALLHEQLK